MNEVTIKYLPRSFEFTGLADALDDPAFAPIAESVSDQLYREMQDRIQKEICSMMGVPRTFAECSASSLPKTVHEWARVYYPELPRIAFHTWLYGVVRQQYSALLNITAYDSEESSPWPRRRANDRIQRCASKMAAAYANCRRAIARGDRRRGDYWYRVVRSWRRKMNS